MEGAFSHGELTKVYHAIMEASQEVARKMRYYDVKHIEAESGSGEKMYNADLVIENIIVAALTASGVVKTVLNGKTQKTIELKGDKYIVAVYPLDGNSVFDADYSFGSIYAIYPNQDLIGATARIMVGAAVALFGPRTTIVLYNQNTQQVDELTFITIGDKEKWMQTKQHLEIKEKGTIFAPGNLRAINDNGDYKKVIDFYFDNGYTLRYSGGLAADCYHLLVKKNGIYTTMGSEKFPQHILLIHEAAPLALLAERSGGIGSNGYQAILDVKIESLTQVSNLFMGSKIEIQRIESMLKDIKQ